MQMYLLMHINTHTHTNTHSLPLTQKHIQTNGTHTRTHTQHTGPGELVYNDGFEGESEA